MSVTENDNDKTITNLPIKEGEWKGFVLTIYTIRNESMQ